MKKKLFETTKEDKKRILGLHESRTKEQYLKKVIVEQEEGEPLSMCKLNYKIKGFGEESNNYVFDNVEILGKSDGVLNLIVSDGSEPLRYVVKNNGKVVFESGYFGGRLKYGSQTNLYSTHPSYVSTLTRLKDDVGTSPKKTFKHINELYYSILSPEGKSKIKTVTDLNRLVFNEKKNQTSIKNKELQESFDDLRELWKEGNRTFTYPQINTQIKNFNYKVDMGVVEVNSVSPFKSSGSIISRGGCVKNG